MEIAVHRLEARYHLASSRPEVKARLDRLLPEAFETALELACELAFERGGVPTDGELVIRELAVPVVLRLADGDARLLVAWADAVAAAVEQALATGDERRVVAFRGRRPALVAFAEDVARGRRERMWAFARLGFASEDAVSSEDAAALDLAKALAAAPEMLVPVLEELGKEGLLPALVARFEPPWWPELAARALAALQQGAAIATLAEPVEPRTLPPAVAVRLRGALGRSPLGRAAAQVAGPARRALQVLAVAAEDPRLLRVLEGVEETDPKDCKDCNDLGMAVPEAAGTSHAASRRDSAASEVLAVDAVLAVQFSSSFSGLLFLLPLVEPFDLAGLLPDRPLRWSLHRLALALVPADSGDPAVLAFCGLAPDAPPPSLDAPPPSEAETEGLSGLAAGLAGSLAERLDEPEATPELLARVTRRRARIVADPGWIEAHFSLDDVSVELRRAGLDLDPGFLPWLGAVVRFVYG
jgi:hypothetical protein